MFTRQLYNKVWNYLSENLYYEPNIQSLLCQCESYGDIVLIGGAIKDIAFFDKTPKDYDIIVVRNNPIKNLEHKDFKLNLNDNTYTIVKNSFSGYKINYKTLTFDIWTCNNIKEIEESSVKFNLDGLYINLSKDKYYSKLFNQGVKEGICKVINNKFTHPDKNRDYERGLNLAKEFNLEYQYK